MALPPQSLVMLGLALQLSLESSSLISSLPFSHTHILSPPIIHHQGLLAPPSCYTGVWRWRGPSQATGASDLTAVSPLPLLQSSLQPAGRRLSLNIN